MKSPKAIYLVTRAHGLRQHLLKLDDLIRMLRTKSIVEMADILFRTDYGTELSKVPLKELDAYQLEKIFYHQLSERLSYLFQITSGKTREALEEYYGRIEAENIKRIIRTLHGGGKAKETSLIPIPRKYQRVNFLALTEASGIREMVDLLRETPYRDISDSVDLYHRYNNPLVLEAQIDKIYFSNLWQKLEEIPDSGDVKQLIGTEIDLKNLLYLFSFKQMKMDPELLKEMMIDIHYKLPKSAIPQLTTASYEVIPGLLTWPPYVDLARKAVNLLDKSLLAETENVFSQHLYSYAETTALRNPNSLVYVFSYLELCSVEARNLTTLAVGKQLGLEEEKVRSSLLL